MLRAATPTFIILFGAMLEIVYRQRILKGDGQGCAERLMIRAAQCYLLYVVSILFFILGGGISWTYGLRCSLYLGTTPYTDILKFYSIMIFFAPLLLIARERLGLWFLFLVSLAIQLSTPLILASPKAPTIGEMDYLSNLTLFLYGGGAEPGPIAGPSILHGLSFIIWGQIAGYAVRSLLHGAEKNERRRGAQILAGLGFGAFIVTAFLWNWEAPRESMARLSDMSLRNANAPLYFSYGLMLAIGGLSLCVWLYDNRNVQVARSLTYLGRTSLFTFAYGNSLLYLLPNLTLTKPQALVLSVVLIAAICAQSFLFWRLQAASGTYQGVMSWLSESLKTLLAEIQCLLAWILRPFSNVYARMFERTAPA